MDCSGVMNGKGEAIILTGELRTVVQSHSSCSPSALGKNKTTFQWSFLTEMKVLVIKLTMQPRHKLAITFDSSIENELPVWFNSVTVLNKPYHDFNVFC